MRDEYFDIYAADKREQTSRYLTVTRIGQAAAFLFHRWPVSRGSKIAPPCQGIMDLMDQLKVVAAAREALSATPK